MACCCNQCNPATCSSTASCYTPCRCVSGQCVACSPAACPNGNECNPPCRCVNGECKGCYTCDGGYARAAWEVVGPDCGTQTNFWYCQTSGQIGVDSCTNKISNTFNGEFRVTFVGLSCGGALGDQRMLEFTVNDSGGSTFPTATACGASGLTVSNVTTYWRFNAAPYQTCDCDITAITTAILYPNNADPQCMNTNNFPRGI